MAIILDILQATGEIFAFVWARKLWWALPPILALLVIGALVMLGQATPVGPFIYTLF